MGALELNRMYKHYGKEFGKKCSGCCNFRKSGHCIAYGETYASGWKPEAVACKLYNRPFCGLSPRCVELGSLYHTKQEKENEEQYALF